MKSVSHVSDRSSREEENKGKEGNKDNQAKRRVSLHVKEGGLRLRRRLDEIPRGGNVL